MAGSDLLQPRIELLACACAQHQGKLLHKVVGQIDLWMQAAKHGKRFLLFHLEVFRSTKKEEGGLSGKYRNPSLKGTLDTGFTPSRKKPQEHLTHTLIRSLVALF